jgi:hypothetical protein
MSDLLDSNQLEEFSNYSEKHSLFDLFSDAVSKVIIARPADPYGFLIDYFTKPRGSLALIRKIYHCNSTTFVQLIKRCTKKLTSSGY